MLKTEIEWFLNLNYKNPKTKRVAKHALDMISHLDKVDIDKINEIIDNLKISNNSKNTIIAYIRKFIKIYCIQHNKHVKYHLLNEYEDDRKLKDIFTNQELEILHHELNNFSNGFKLAWLLLEENGCRIDELVNVPWKMIKNTNYEWFGKALKNNNSRIYVVPKNLINYFEENVDLIPSKSHINNTFAEFRKYIKTKYPDWNKEFTSHWLRVNKITKMFISGMSIEEIMIFTGHKQSSTIMKHYVKISKEQMRIIQKRSQLNIVDGIDLNKYKNYINEQNKQLIYLKSDNQKLIEELNSLKNKEIKDDTQIKNANCQTVGVEFKTDTLKS